MVYASQGRVNLGREGAGVYIYIRASAGRAYRRVREIDKEASVYTYKGRACIHKRNTGTHILLSRVLKHLFMSRVLACIPRSAFLFSTSPSRALERSNVKAGGRR